MVNAVVEVEEMQTKEILLSWWSLVASRSSSTKFPSLAQTPSYANEIGMPVESIELVLRFYFIPQFCLEHHFIHKYR